MIVPGSIVMAQGATAEVILGIVLGPGVETETTTQVAWISDRRGIFICNEADGDITAVQQVDRAEMTDRTLNHGMVAHALRRLVAELD